jgi:hypothetical protein
MGALRISRNRRYKPRLASGAVPAGLVAVVVAATAGWTLAHGLAAPPAAPKPQRPLSIRLPNTRIELRSAWRPAARPVAVPGLAAARAFAPADGSAGQLILALNAGTRVLPAETVAALRIPLGGARRVKVAGRPSVGYSALALRGVAGLADLYSVPTVAGTLVVACVAPLDAPLSAAACPGDVLAIAAQDPARALRSRAPSIMGRLGPLRTARRAALRRARTPAAQASIASRLAAAYAAAATATAEVTPSSEAGGALSRALGAAAHAYDRLAAAARRHSRPGWARARRAVYAAEQRVRAALRF